MATLSITKHIVFWLILCNIKDITAKCKFYSTQPPEEGRACHFHEYTNISFIERNHCALACARDNECKATVHDSHHSVCMLFPESCMLLLPHAGYVYQSLQRPCTKWVPNSVNSPGYWIYEREAFKSYIARTLFNDDIVLGRATWKFFAICPSGKGELSSYSYEKLVVDSSCGVTWGRTVYPKKYAHGFCFAVLCCGYTLTDFSISIRLTSLALWQSNNCPSASKATLMNMDKYFMWIHYERLHNHNKAKHNKTVCIFLGIYCMMLPLDSPYHLVPLLLM